MFSAVYFWKNKQLHVYEGDNSTQSVKEAGFERCFAVDTFSETPSLRYGKYLKRGWVPIPLEKLPKAFRTNLLLLGIS